MTSTDKAKKNLFRHHVDRDFFKFNGRRAWQDLHSEARRYKLKQQDVQQLARYCPEMDSGGSARRPAAWAAPTCSELAPPLRCRRKLLM